MTRPTRAARGSSLLCALLPVLAWLPVAPGTAFGDTGIFNGFAVLNSNGAGNVFYDLNPQTQTATNPDFNGANLGVFQPNSNTLILNGGELQTFKNAGNGDDVTGAFLNYRLRFNGSTPGFSSTSLPFNANLNNGNGDQRWQATGANLNLLNRVSVGTYHLEVYGSATTNRGDRSFNNGGANYTATFTVTAGTYNYTGTSGNLSDATRYAGGLAPGNGHNLQFNSSSNPAALNNDALTSAASLSFGPGNQTLTGNDLGVTTGNVAVATGATATLGLSLNGTNPLNKTGNGTLVLTVANTYSGGTTVNAGTLQAGVGTLVNVGGGVTVNSGGTLLLSGNGRHIGASIPVTLNGGTFHTGGVAEPGGTDTIGALTLQSSSVIDLGNGASVLNFASSGGQTWAGTLSILNWTGTLTTGNGIDQLEFGDSATAAGLTPAQLAMIQFVNPAGLAPGTYGAAFAVGDLSEVVPSLVAVPEPSTVIAGLLGLGCLAQAALKRRRQPVPAA